MFVLKIQQKTMKKAELGGMPGLNTVKARDIAVAISGVVALDDFKQALEKGGKVILTGDITIDEPIDVTQDSEIDLNGHTIKSSAETALNFTGGTSKIGGGTVIGASGKSANLISVGDGATLTIESGTYSIGKDDTGEGNDCIYSTGGNINITGGTFSSEGLFRGRHWVLNRKNGTGGKIKVTGGRFKNFDPANPKTDDDDSYVETGYESVADYYEVHKQEL